MDQVFGAQIFIASIAPLLAHALVQAFRKRLGQSVRDRLRHDRVVVVVRGPESVNQCLQSDPARYREGSHGVAKPSLHGRNEIRKRTAGVDFVSGAFPVRLLPKKMQPVQNLTSSAVRVQLHIVAHRVGRKKSIRSARRQQLLRDDPVQQHIGFCENLARLLTLPLVRENPRVNAL